MNWRLAKVMCKGRPHPLKYYNSRKCPSGEGGLFSPTRLMIEQEKKIQIHRPGIVSYFPPQQSDESYQ